MKKIFFTVLTTVIFMVGIFGVANAIPTTLIDMGSTWEYSVLETDLWDNWATAGYDSFEWDSATTTWATGDAAFGNDYVNPPNLPYNTYWAPNTDLALEKEFFIDGVLLEPIQLNVASDNGFMVFINGEQVAKANAEGYTVYWEYEISLLPPDFLSPGSNLIQVLAEDHGGATYFDLELTGDVAPVPEPTTLFLLGTGLLGLAGFRRKIKK